MTLPVLRPGERQSACLWASALGRWRAAMLAQWGPAPDIVPHALHMLLAAAGGALVLPVPETRRGPEQRAPGAAPRISATARGRFATAIVPVAPWVFACATIAFTVLPGRAAAFAHGWAPLATGIITALTLGVGVAVQPLARRLESRPSWAARGGLITAGAGLALAATAASTAAWALVVAAALVLGAAYGQLLVAGLREVERLAVPDTLARLVARFYALAYAGVFAPYALALVASVAGYPRALALAGLLALVVLVAVSLRLRPTTRA